MTKYQVKYKDSNNDPVVLSQLRTNNTDSDLDADAITQADRILITREAQGQDKAKVWCDPAIVGNLPVVKSKYGTAQNGEDEREILIQRWNGSSWDTRFRGKPKAKPSTDDSGQALFVLQGFSQQTGKEDVTYDSGGTTQTIDTILQSGNILPPGYTLDVAPAADFNGGSIPERENYRIIDNQRQIAYRELTKTPDVSLQFTSDLSSGDYKVRLEPRGHGGTVDTIQGPRDKTSSGTLGLFREWEGENPETVINKVKITGTNENGEEITDANGNFPIVKDQTSIDDYGVKFKSKNIPYADSFSEGEEIGKEILRGDPVPGGGVVKTPLYTDRVVNSSFQLKDSRNNVDGVYTAVKTRHYLHEQATELVFEYETSSEKTAENEVETVYERNKVYPSGQEDVGQQGLSNVSTGQAPSDTAVSGSVSDNSSDTSVNGSIDREGLNNIFDPFNNGYNDTGISTGQWNTISGADINTGTYTSFIFYSGYVEFRYTETSSGATTQPLQVKVRLKNTSKNEYFPSSNGYVIFGEVSDNANSNIFTKNQSFTLPLVISSDSSLDFDWTEDNIELQVFVEDNSTISSQALEVDGFAITQEGQTHGDDFGTTDSNHGHGDDFGTTDSDHGGVNQSTPHGIASTNNDPPTTDSQNVEIASEDKTDR